MAIIPLTRGKFAIVDDEDFEYLSQWKWHCTSAGYAARRGPRCSRHPAGPMILMHRQIMQARPAKYVDHINHDRLDNRRSNLRFATGSENGYNRSKQANSTTGIVGVCFSKRERKYKSYINVDKKRLHLGTHVTLEDAREAVDAARQRMHGAFAYAE